MHSIGSWLHSDGGRMHSIGSCWYGGILWGVQWDVANEQGYSEEGHGKYIPALISPQIQVIGDRDYT